MTNEYTKIQFEEDSEQKLERQEQLAQAISQTVENMRRLKIRIDLKSVKNAERKIFSEHANLDLTKEYVQLEKLEEYLKLPENMKVKSKIDILEDKAINNLVTR